MKPFTTPPSLDCKLEPSPEMKKNVADVEEIVGYKFKNKRLLEEALTHPSFSYFASYRRLAFIGDAVLGLAISNHLFITHYPNMDQGHFSLLRSANVGNDRFARVALHYGLYSHLRRNNSEDLDRQVKEFIDAGEIGSVGAPKVLADIVESVAGAMYIDLNFDLNQLWLKFKPLLDPIVTAQDLQEHPVTVLNNLCQKRDVALDIKGRRDNTKNLSIASVHVDSELVASDSSKNMKCARLNAATQALSNLSKIWGVNDGSSEAVALIGATQKLNELCVRKRLPQPEYKIERESGPPHEKKFVYSVTIGTQCITGDEKLNKKEAKNSAASLMICCLEDESDDDFMINNNNPVCCLEDESDDDFMINNNNPVPFVYTVWRIISRGVMRLFVFCFKGVILLIILSIVAKLLME